MAELERSIRNIGLLQPIVVREAPAGYEVVFGNHRLEACKQLGMKRVNAIVKAFTEEEAFLARVSENLLRNTYIDPIEEAEGYRMLVKKGWTINAIGCKVGKSDSYVCERLGMIERLSSEARSEVSRGFLTASHAEVLSRIRDKSMQKEIAKLVKKKRLSVRSLEEIVSGFPRPTKVPLAFMLNEYYLRIPSEFLRAMGVEGTQQLLMYLRGRKLILETIENSHTTRRNPNCRKSRPPEFLRSYPSRLARHDNVQPKTRHGENPTRFVYADA